MHHHCHRTVQGPASGEGYFEQFVSVPLITSVFVYIGLLILHVLGRLHSVLMRISLYNVPIDKEPERTKHFLPLYSVYETFYERNVYRRLVDCFNRPICSAPAAYIQCMDRASSDYGWSLRLTGGTTSAINFGSYNYLGFGDANSPTREDNIQATSRFGVGVASPRQEVGSLILHKTLEDLVAEFIGQEAAIVFNMGFATNSLNLPCLVDKDCCVVSDELNHTSLVLGCRLSGATIRVFKHNNMDDLEQVLHDAVVYGIPRTHRPYKKILIVIEGVYSMEGSIVHLPEVVALKKKYKAYLYLDEAHSIGALGPRGRGVCDYYGIDPREIDVCMGTFTKSFGSSGGYLAGSRRLIDYLRVCSHSTVYGGSMPAPIAQQIITSMKIIMGKLLPGEGACRIRKLAENTRYFRARLHAMQLIVYGNRDSPVVPVIICMPAKLSAFSRRCLDLGLAVVVVGFPATPLLTSRVRFCISSAHTKQILEQALDIIETVSDEVGIRFNKGPIPAWVQEMLRKETPDGELGTLPVKQKPKEDWKKYHNDAFVFPSRFLKQD